MKNKITNHDHERWQERFPYLLTSKHNDTQLKAVFSGGISNTSHKMSGVLELTINTHGHATLTINKDDGSVWSFILDNEQRKQLSKLLVQYEPVLWEVLENE